MRMHTRWSMVVAGLWLMGIGSGAAAQTSEWLVRGEEGAAVVEAVVDAVGAPTLQQTRVGVPAIGASSVSEISPLPVRVAFDPDIARRRAFRFPGAGHFYTGETGRGALLLGVSVASLTAGFLIARGGDCDDDGPGSNCVYNHEKHTMEKETSALPLVAGVGGALAAWAYGVMDAPNSAQRQNGANGIAVGPIEIEPRPVLGFTRSGGAAVGMQMRVVW